MADHTVSRRAFIGAGVVAAASGAAALAGCGRRNTQTTTTSEKVEPQASSHEDDATEVAAAVSRDLGTSSFEVSSVDVKAKATETVDVVVVGSGMAGFSCALTLAELAPDATVVLFEKQASLGGSTNSAERPIGDLPLAYTEAEARVAAASAQATSRGVANPLLLYSLFRDAEENFAWLFDEHGVEWKRQEVPTEDAGAENAEGAEGAVSAAVAQASSEIPDIVAAANAADEATAAGESEAEVEEAAMQAAVAEEDATAEADAAAEEDAAAAEADIAADDWRTPGSPVLYGSGTGAAAIRTFNSQAVSHANLRIISERPVTQLLLKDDYTVTGVRTREGSDYYDFSASAVVLCTGGMSTNKTLLANYSSQDMEKIIGWGSGQDGDGHLMAEQTAHGRANNITIDTLENTVKGLPYASALGACAGMQPTVCWVNQNGLRFMDENIADAAVSGKVVEAQGSVWSLMDADAVARYAEGGCTRRYAPFADALVGNPISNLQEQIDAAIKEAPEECFTADDISSLANAVGVDADNLKATLAVYNTGVDAEWGKDGNLMWPVINPPLYAFRVSSGMRGTSGGVRINTNAQVTDARGKPVKGLYAAGAVTSGWYGEVYGAGSCQAVALWGGRTAAKHIAETILA